MSPLLKAFNVSSFFRCLVEWWFVEFKVSDSGTGLNRINVNQNSQDVRVPYTNEQILYYRYYFLVSL